MEHKQGRVAGSRAVNMGCAGRSCVNMAWLARHASAQGFGRKTEGVWSLLLGEEEAWGKSHSGHGVPVKRWRWLLSGETRVWQGHELPTQTGWGRRMLLCGNRAGQGMRQQQNSGMEKFGKAAPLLSSTAALQMGQLREEASVLRCCQGKKKVWKDPFLLKDGVYYWP